MVMLAVFYKDLLQLTASCLMYCTEKLFKLTPCI